MSEVAWMLPSFWSPSSEYKRLNPTGRWKTEYNPYTKGFYMLVEHKGFFLNRWVYEGDIEFLPTDYGTAFECGKGN